MCEPCARPKRYKNNLARANHEAIALHTEVFEKSRKRFEYKRPVHCPETLRRWLSEPETLQARLRHMPPLVTEGLRQCQIEAIDGLEKSLARGDPRALIQMC